MDRARASSFFFIVYVRCRSLALFAVLVLRFEEWGGLEQMGCPGSLVIQ